MACSGCSSCSGIYSPFRFWVLPTPNISKSIVDDFGDPFFKWGLGITLRVKSDHLWNYIVGVTKKNTPILTKKNTLVLGQNSSDRNAGYTKRKRYRNLEEKLSLEGLALLFHKKKHLSISVLFLTLFFRLSRLIGSALSQCRLPNLVLF